MVLSLGVLEINGLQQTHTRMGLRYLIPTLGWLTRVFLGLFQSHSSCLGKVLTSAKGITSSSKSISLLVTRALLVARSYYIVASFALLVAMHWLLLLSDAGR